MRINLVAPIFYAEILKNLACIMISKPVNLITRYESDFNFK